MRINALSCAQPASLFVDARSRDGSPSPAVILTRPMSAASNGIARSQWSVGISETSERSPSESSTVINSRTDTSLHEGNRGLSSRASNFDEDVVWEAFPAPSRYTELIISRFRVLSESKVTILKSLLICLRILFQCCS